MKKLFKIPRRKTSFDAFDTASIVTTASDVIEIEIELFHKAVWQCDMAMLEQLVKNIDVNQVDKQNRTALHLACACGNVEVVIFLIENHAEVNLRDSQNKSALIQAVQEKHDTCANILLENKADPNLVDTDGNTALHLASSIPSITTVVLLVNHGADINVKNLEGMSPLSVAVQGDHIEVAEFLLKNGANVNVLDRQRRSPLMIASGKGHFTMVQLLLQFKVNIELTDSRGLLAEDDAESEYQDPVHVTEHRIKEDDSIQVQPSLKCLEYASSEDAENVDCVSPTDGHKDDLKQTECDMSRLIKVLPQLKKNKKFDIEEAGSDRDKTNNATEASDASQEFPECSDTSVEVREVEEDPKAPERNISDISDEKDQSSRPKPRSKKLVPESEKTDYDPDVLFEPCLEAKTEDQHCEEVLGPGGSPRASIMEKDICTKTSQPEENTSGELLSGSTSDADGRGSEGHAREKVSRKDGSLRTKDTSSQSSPFLYSEKQPTSRSQSNQQLQKQHSEDMGTSKEVDGIKSSSDEAQDEDSPYKVRLEGIVSQQNKHHCCSEKMAKLKEEKAQLKSQMEEVDDDDDDEHKCMQMENERRSSSKQQEDDGHNPLTPIVKMAQHNIYKLEEELRQARAQLSQERCSNAQLQQKLMTRDEKQQTLEEDYRSTPKSTKELEEEPRQAHVQLPQERRSNAPSSHECCKNAVMQQKQKTQDSKQQSMKEDYKKSKHCQEHARTELEATQARSSTKLMDRIEENEELDEQVEDRHQDLRSDKQAQSGSEWSGMITGLKCEVSRANARLAEAKQLRFEMEKTLLQEKEEQQRLRDKLASEKASQQEALTNLTHKLSKAKAYGNSMENELQAKDAKYLQAMKEMKEQAILLDEREKELSIAAQKQKEAQAAVAASNDIAKQLEEAVQRLEPNNNMREGSAKRHSRKCDARQKVSQEDARLSAQGIRKEMSGEDIPRPTHRGSSSNRLNRSSSRPEPPPPVAEEAEVDDDNDAGSDGSGEVTADGSAAPDREPSERGAARQRDNALFLDLQRCVFQMLERELTTLNTHLQSLQSGALQLLASMDGTLQRIADTATAPSPVRSRWTLRKK
ncbi:uncharacterized protein LOC144053700 isoform X3 [Vanacampus margaritifer]